MHSQDMQNKTKQTQQLLLQDVAFFKKARYRMAVTEAIMRVYSMILKLENQKNWWEGMCDSEEILCPAQSFTWQFLDLCDHLHGRLIMLRTAFHSLRQHWDMLDDDSSQALNWL